MEVDDFGAFQGRDWADFWDGEGRAAAEAAMAEARVGGTGRFAGFARTAKGTPRWWDVQVTPIPDRDGTPSKLLSISRDITRERERQLAVDEQNARLRLLADAATQLMAGKDPDAVLQALFETIAMHLDIDVCLHFTAAADGSLRLQGSIGVSDMEFARVARVALGETVCGMVALSHRPIYRPNVQSSQVRRRRRSGDSACGLTSAIR